MFPVGSVEEITAVQFPFLFSGSEIVVAGKFNQITENITVQVTGQGLDSSVTYESSVSTVTDTVIAGSLPSTERLRAYLEIKDLLDQKRLAEINGENTSVIEERALQLSLRYNFVTELTSLIVIEESSNMTIDNEDDDDQTTDDGEFDYTNYNYGGPVPASVPPPCPTCKTGNPSNSGNTDDIFISDGRGSKSQ